MLAPAARQQEPAPVTKSKPAKLRPLARPKFWAETQRAYVSVLSALGHKLSAPRPWAPDDYDGAARGLCALDAELRAALDRQPSVDSTLAFSLRSLLEQPPLLSHMVAVQFHAGQPPRQRVGQLAWVDRLVYGGGQRRLYEDDGGPARFSTRYNLQLLDGRIMSWENCAVKRLLTARELCEELKYAQLRSAA